MKNKKEVWRVQYVLTRIRKAARELLTLEENDPRRIFEGAALISRMMRIGVLNKDQGQLDYVLGLTTRQFLERRLQLLSTHLRMPLPSIKPDHSYSKKKLPLPKD